MLTDAIEFRHAFKWERIIVPLDRHFVVYTGDACVDEGTGVDEGDVFFTGSLFYTGTLFCRDAGIEEGSGWCRKEVFLFYTSTGKMK